MREAKEPHLVGASLSQITQWVRGEEAEVPICLGQQWFLTPFFRTWAFLSPMEFEMQAGLA